VYEREVKARGLPGMKGGRANPRGGGAIRKERESEWEKGKRRIEENPHK